MRYEGGKDMSDDVKYVIVNCADCKEPAGEVAEKYEDVHVICEECQMKRLNKFRTTDNG
jgi:DNA-directed RNA polymerase subunit RPC12/RpoP